MSELLPCPFCGGDAQMSWYAKGSELDRAGYFVECDTCSAGGEPFDIQGEMPDRDEITKEAAISAWNLRAPPASPTGRQLGPGKRDELPPIVSEGVGGPLTFSPEQKQRAFELIEPALELEEVDALRRAYRAKGRPIEASVLVEALQKISDYGDKHAGAEAQHLGRIARSALSKATGEGE